MPIRNTNTVIQTHFSYKNVASRVESFCLLNPELCLALAQVDVFLHWILCCVFSNTLAIVANTCPTLMSFCVWFSSFNTYRSRYGNSLRVKL